MIEGVASGETVVDYDAARIAAQIAEREEDR